jgi:hypothetical protein
MAASGGVEGREQPVGELGRPPSSFTVIAYLRNCIRHPRSEAMTPARSSASLRAVLPSLPIELRQLILRFCDVPTLVATSLVSLAFLELSTPILYQDIELIGLQRVEQLFCHSVSPPSAQA